MLTCFGSASRNRTVGARLGRGETIEQVLASMSEVAEGVATAPAAVRLARNFGVDAPMIETVAAVIAGTITARYGASLFHLALTLSQGWTHEADEPASQG